MQRPARQESNADMGHTAKHLSTHNALRAAKTSRAADGRIAGSVFIRVAGVDWRRL